MGNVTLFTVGDPTKGDNIKQAQHLCADPQYGSKLASGIHPTEADNLLAKTFAPKPLKNDYASNPLAGDNFVGQTTYSCDKAK